MPATSCRIPWRTPPNGGRRRRIPVANPNRLSNAAGSHPSSPSSHSSNSSSSSVTAAGAGSTAAAASIATASTGVASSSSPPNTNESCRFTRDFKSTLRLRRVSFPKFDRTSKLKTGSISRGGGEDDGSTDGGLTAFGKRTGNGASGTTSSTFS